MSVFVRMCVCVCVCVCVFWWAAVVGGMCLSELQHAIRTTTTLWHTCELFLNLQLLQFLDLDPY
jgi:hypothetical protein